MAKNEQQMTEENEKNNIEKFKMISENIHKFCEENDIHIMEYLLSIVKLLDWNVIFSNDDNDKIDGIILGSPEYIEEMFKILEKEENKND